MKRWQGSQRRMKRYERERLREEKVQSLIRKLRNLRMNDRKACGVQGHSPGWASGGRSHSPNFFLAKWVNPWTHFFQNFKSVQIYMKDVECAEANEKSVFAIFTFRDMVVFVPIFR